jgi:hypothetical protein
MIVVSLEVTVKPLESRTVTETLESPAADGEQATMAAVPMHAAGKWFHKYVYMPEPPVGETERLIVWPTSRAAWDKTGAWTVGSGRTSYDRLWLTTPNPLESVTNTCTENDPGRLVAHEIDERSEETQPGSPIQTNE